MVDQTYYEEGYIETGYYVYTASAESLITTNVSVASTPSVIKAGAADLQVALTQSALMGKLISVTLEFEALFTPSVDAEAVINSFAIIESDTDLTSTVSKFTGYESLLEFFAALNAQNDRTRSTDSALGASFDVTSDTARLRDHTASLAVSFDSATDAEKIVETSAQLSTAAGFSVEVQVARFVNADADLDSAFNASATAISYQLRPDLYARPIDLDSAPYLFDSTLKRYGSHSLRTNFNTLERTQDNAALTPSIGEDFVIEFWFNPDASLLANTEPSFLSYGFFTNRDLVNVSSSGNPSWGFGRTSGTNPRLQFKFWHGNQIYQLLDQTLYTTRIQQNDGWINLAFVRDNNVGRFFVNNAQQSSVNLPSNVTFRTPSVGSRAIYLGGPYTVGASTQGANYDELRIARGTTQRRTWSAPATNDENTVLLHHFDNSGLDDVQFVVDLVQTFTAQTQMQVDANIQRTGAALLASGGTLTAEITVFSAVTIDVESVFTVDADAGLLQFAQADLGALFTPSITASAINPGEVEATAIFSTTADANRIRSTASAQSAQTNLNVTVDRLIGEINADLNADVNISVTAEQFYSLGFFATSLRDPNDAASFNNAAISGVTSTESVTIDPEYNAIYTLTERDIIDNTGQSPLSTTDVLITKFTGRGSVVWTREYENIHFTSEANNDDIREIVNTPDNLIFILAQSSPTRRSLLHAVSKDTGEPIYYKTGQHLNHDIAVSGDYVYTLGAEGDLVFILQKINASTGNNEFTRYFKENTTNFGDGTPKVLVTDTNIFILRRRNANSVLILKLDTAGNIVSQHSLSVGNSAFRGAAIGTNGIIYILTTDINTTLSAVNASDLGLVFSKDINVTGSNIDQQEPLIIDADNSVYINGEQQVLKLDSAGNVVYYTTNNYADQDIAVHSEWLLSTDSEVAEAADLNLAQVFADGSNTRFAIENFDYDTRANPTVTNASASLSSVTTVVNWSSFTGFGATQTSLFKNNFYTELELVFLARLITGDAEISAESDLTALGGLVRDYDSAVTSTATLETVAVITASATAPLTAQADITVVNDRIRDNLASLNTASTLSVEGDRVRPFSAELNSESTLTAQAQRFRDTATALDAVNDLAVDNARIRDVETQLDSIATTLAAVVKVGDFLLGFDAFFTSDVSAIKVTETATSLDASTQLTVAGTVTRSAVAEVNSESTVFADALKVIQFNSDVLAEFAQETVANKTVSAQCSADSEFTAQITPIRVRFNTVTLNTLSELAIDYAVLVSGEADLGAEFTGVFALGRVRRITETLSAQGFVVTVGDVINIDDYRLLIVPRETRQLKVKQETNTIRVPRETRILIL